MKKILVLFITAIIMTSGISAYAFFPKLPAGNAEPFDTTALKKKKKRYLNDYIGIVKELSEAYLLIAEAVIVDKEKDKTTAVIKSLQASNTESDIKEIQKLTKNTSKEIDKELKKAKDLDDNQKELLLKATKPYLSANAKMALLLTEIGVDSAIVGKAIANNPTQALAIKDELKTLLLLANVLPGYSKMNIKTLDLLISTLEKNGVDMSKQKKQKEEAQSQGAE